MLQVGLTGGIACGKTTVSKLFGECGAAIVDADVLAHEVVRPGSAGLAEVVSHFGSNILTPEGTLDRAAMRQLIFSDKHTKQPLESILHPRIHKAMASAVQQFQSQGYPYCIKVIPLLFETNQQHTNDRILVIDCQARIQIQRIIARDAATQAAAGKILASQIPRAQRIAQADDLIINNGEYNLLKQQVEKLHALYSGDHLP